MAPMQAEAFASVLNQITEATLATVRPDGWPQATVVSFVSDGETLWFGCLKTSQKVSNLAADPRVSMTVMAPYLAWGDISAYSLAGKVRPLIDAAEIAAFAQHWHERFPYMDEVLRSNGDNFQLFELKPEWITRMDFHAGLGHRDNPATGA